MSILFDKKKRTFTLLTENTSYQMQVDAYNVLLHLYYGKKTAASMDYLLTYADRGFSGNPYDSGADRTYSLDALPLEFPTRGNGDYRSPSLVIKNSDGSYSCDLRYKNHEIVKGKYGLPGLPAVYAKEQDAETLKIQMEDSVTKVQVTLLYGVLPKADIITRSVEITNGDLGQIEIQKVHSACLDFLQGKYDFLRFYGRHAMERNLERSAVGHGMQSIGSRRGTSSHQYNPGMILAKQETTEKFGSCWGMVYVYSGNFTGEVEQDQYNQTRMSMGMGGETFSYPLNAQETFTSPEVIMSYSGSGLNRLSQNFHSCIRSNLCRGKYRDEIRPILLNSWEASYFDFTGDTICELAEEAAKLDIEMLVMDDGWFGKRDDDNSGLGDWYVNEKKLGGTLGDLIHRINDMGLKFGIWIEPEMVNEDSDLYRAHPDWALSIPGRNPVRGRNQLVLDFSRKEVVDGVYEQICSMLDQGNIEYIKWDMNRSLEDVYSAEADNQGRVYHDYILGLYDFLERLMKRYPNILMEGCSGGGGRFDAGMLYYTPQIWCSDNTDAVDRTRIQYGTSFFYPISAVGSHVSAVPNHQTGRSVSLKTRGVTAMAGTFGYELNLHSLEEEEKAEIRSQIAAYHKYAALIQGGKYYRLSNPFSDEIAAWEFISQDKSEVLVNVVKLEIHGNMTPVYVALDGLDPDGMYTLEENGVSYSAVALMEIGLPLPQELGSYMAYQYHLKKSN